MLIRNLVLDRQAKASWAERLRPSHLLFLLFFAVKPFYLGDPGTLQIADGIFLLSLLAFMIEGYNGMQIQRSAQYFGLFTLGVVLVNGFYAITTGSSEFLTHISYYLFNLLVILVFSQLMHNPRFLMGLLLLCIVNLLVQLGIQLSGGGRMYLNVRFMGTFTDPNQFSFSMFTSFLIAYLVNARLKDQGMGLPGPVILGLFLLAFYFIVQGSSTGMLLGMGSFALFFGLIFVFTGQRPVQMYLKVLLSIGLVLGFVLLVSYDYQAPAIDGSASSGSFLLARLFGKFDKVDAGGLQALLNERGINKLQAHPLQLLVGAGEGNWSRFPYSPFEVHSTFPGILFYYGAIPFLFLLRFLRDQLKGIPAMAWPVYLGLLMESLTLANQRQPAFWMIILLGSLLSQEEAALGPKNRGLRRRV